MGRLTVTAGGWCEASGYALDSLSARHLRAARPDRTWDAVLARQLARPGAADG